MKERLTIDSIHNGYLKGKADTKGWALCIGAGVSQPIFPDWKSLVKNLILKDPNLKDINSINEILASFSLDALIQSYSQLFKLNENEATKQLSEELYKKIQLGTTSEEWDAVCNIFTNINANRQRDNIWIEFIKVRERLFKNTSSYGLAKSIVKSFKDKVAPSAILSFNAEPLLYALVNSFQRETFIGKVKKKNDVTELMDLITISLSSKCKGRIPYYFCHGALLSYLTSKKDIRLQSTSKLVFSESSYLQIANTSFSWQSVNFLNICSSNVVIFAGVSLTDPNMRKWLSWIQSERSSLLPKDEDSTQHFWINKKPEFEDTMHWTEAAVSHLGVRVIWINEWNELEIVLNKLLGL